MCKALLGIDLRDIEPLGVMFDKCRFGTSGKGATSAVSGLAGDWGGLVALFLQH